MSTSDKTRIYLWMLKAHSKLTPMTYTHGPLLGAKSRMEAMALYRELGPLMVVPPPGGRPFTEEDFVLARGEVEGSTVLQSTLEIVGALLFLKPDCERAAMALGMGVGDEEVEEVDISGSRMEW